MYDGEPYDFNSHAHVERDYQHLTLLSQFDNFNSHAHVERDILEDRALEVLEDFNSHAHVERDLPCSHFF